MRGRLIFRTFPTYSRKGDRRRAEILEAALALIGRGGLERLSFDRIAKRLRLARPHIVYYFKTQEDLYYELIRQNIADLQEFTIAHLGVDPSLRKLIEAPFLFYEKNPQYAPVTHLLFHLAIGNALFSDLHAGFRRAGRERIEAGVHLARPKLHVRAAKECAFCIHGMITACLMDCLAARAGWSFREAARIVEARALELLGAAH